MTRRPVGRDPELAAIAEALDAAAAGRARTVLLSGEAGIGKSTLARAAADMAVREGFGSVVWGRCWEGATPPGWLWRQVLRGLSSNAEEAGAPATTSAQVTAVAKALATAEGPVAVILEDLHDADATDLEVFQRILERCARLPLLMIGTFREGARRRSDEVAAALSELIGRHTHLLLGGLDVAAVTDMLAQRAPHVGPQRAEQICRSAAGNPLLVSLLVRTGARTGRDLPSPSDPPEELRVHVRRQVDRLPPETRRLLPLLTVHPDPGTLRELAVAAGFDADTLSDLLAPAVSEGLIEEAETGFRYRHQVVRASIYADLSPTARAHLHGEAARAMRRSGARGPVARARITHHEHHAFLGDGDPEEHLAELRTVAGDALAVGAVFEAAQLLTHAVGAAEAAGASAAERGRLLLDLAAAQDAIGERTEAEHSRHAAAALARLSGDPQLLAEAVVASARADMFLGLPRPGHLHLLEEALEALPRTMTPLRAEVLGHLAPALYWTPERSRANVLAAQAVSVARASGDADAIAVGLLARHYVLRGPEHAVRRIDLAAEALTAADAAGDDDLGFIARSALIADRRELGDPAGVAAAIRDLRRFARVRNHDLGRWAAEVHELVSAVLGGDEDAIALQERVVARMSEEDRDRRYLRDLALHMTNPGRLSPSARERVEERARTMPDVPSWRARALVDAAERGDESARAELSAILALLRGKGRSGAHWLLTATLAAEAAVLLDDHDAAAALRALLEPHAEAFVVASRVAACRGHVRHHLGALALVTGDTAAALADLEVAERLHETSGQHAYLVRTRRLLRTARAQAPAGAATELGSLQRRGAYWVIQLPTGAVSLPDIKGMRYLAALIGAPHQPIAALHLARLEPGGRASAGAHESLLALDSGRSEAVLDASAKRAFRRRLGEIAAALASEIDPTRVERLRVEERAIQAALESATGLGGRDRLLPSDAERARTSVTKALRGAVERIRQVEPFLAAHLDASLRTGAQCVYAPAGPALRLRRS